MKVLTVFGTRPEAIKLAPVILELKKHGIDQAVCVTGQHRQMLDQMLDLFDIRPDFDLNIMSERQTLEDITTRALELIQPVIKASEPDLVLVQGDTTTAFVAALAGFYHQIPVGHVEAGLRTSNRYNPFPEEMNRRLTTQLADHHFAPTQLAKQNLLRDGVEGNKITITGNTVIDALQLILARQFPLKAPELSRVDFSKRVILLTTHRRENLGDGMKGIFRAVQRIAGEYSDVEFIFPVHLNPAVQRHARDLLGNSAAIHLMPPLSYSDLVGVMARSYLVMTDSGGIQEEAPSLGKPVLVLRSNTERPEGVEAGTARLIGTEEESVYAAAKELLDNASAYQEMARATSPYGDGHAAEKIVRIITERNA